MIWLVIVLALIWLVPPLAAAGAALVYLASPRFRGWLRQVLFGEGLPDARETVTATEVAVRTSER